MWEYLTFKGSLSRVPYLGRALASIAIIIIPLVMAMIAVEGRAGDETIIPLGFLAAVCIFFGSWCSMATEVRRWRDMGLSPWWFLGRAMIGWLVSALLGSGAGAVVNIAAVIVLASIPTAYFVTRNLTAENS